MGIKGQQEIEEYDLAQIQESGELIAVTLSGPSTYYEYRGQGFGLQFELAEHFAQSIGVKLRIEIVKDTSELLHKLTKNEADLVALELPQTNPWKKEFLFCGSTNDSTYSPHCKSLSKQWIVRKNSPLLAEALNEWYRSDIKQELRKKNELRFAQGFRVRRRTKAPIQSEKEGIISPYDPLFIRHSQAIGWDWRLMAAQCYQESGFDPEAISWAGARGLMQIMPGTARQLDLPEHQIHNPEMNVAAAARYLRLLTGKFQDIQDAQERIYFILASYNGGNGHVRDAMALTRKNGKNPYLWTDVAPYILLLSEPRYYNDPVVRNGYLRGQETYGYVKSICERWETYRRNIRPVTSGSIPSPAKKSLKEGYKSKVVHPEKETETPIAIQ